MKSASRVKPSPPPVFQLSVCASTGQRFVPYLRRHLRAASQLVRTRLTELSIVLVGDKRMSDLHLQFMDIAGPTDVLTFPIDEDSRGRPVAGEVYVCVPEALRQARWRGSEPRDEVLLYALHGLLHLSGFDDRTDAQYRRMHRTEDDILSRLGVGRVFATGPAATADKGTTDKGTTARKSPVRRSATARSTEMGSLPPARPAAAASDRTGRRSRGDRSR